jgi:hypothetical protein
MKNDRLDKIEKVVNEFEEKFKDTMPVFQGSLLKISQLVNHIMTL